MYIGGNRNWNMKNNLVAEIYHSTIYRVLSTSREQGFGGYYPVIVSMAPTGTALAPYLTCDDQPIGNYSVNFLKLLDAITVTTVRSKLQFIWESRRKNILMRKRLCWKVLIPH